MHSGEVSVPHHTRHKRVPALRRVYLAGRIRQAARQRGAHCRLLLIADQRLPESVRLGRPVSADVLPQHLRRMKAAFGSCCQWSCHCEPGLAASGRFPPFLMMLRAERCGQLAAHHTVSPSYAIDRRDLRRIAWWWDQAAQLHMTHRMNATNATRHQAAQSVRPEFQHGVSKRRTHQEGQLAHAKFDLRLLADLHKARARARCAAGGLE